MINTFLYKKGFKLIGKGFLFFLGEGVHIGRALVGNNHTINKAHWQNKAMTFFNKLILSMKSVTIRVPNVNEGMIMPNKTYSYLIMFMKTHISNYILRPMHNEYLYSSLIIHCS